MLEYRGLLFMDGQEPQMYRGSADWTLIGEVRNNPRMRIPIIGNGDIDGPVKAK
jgi:tRNA-dihydrouridine synthase B